MVASMVARGAGMLLRPDGRRNDGCSFRLAVSMFLLFLPTGPIATEMFEIVPAHLRASAMALCTFFIHLFGDLGSPALVGSVSKRSIAP